jgi:hypothetical protein
VNDLTENFNASKMLHAFCFLKKRSTKKMENGRNKAHLNVSAPAEFTGPIGL